MSEDSTAEEIDFENIEEELEDAGNDPIVLFPYLLTLWVD